MAKDSETVLEGFQEGPLKFPPTYKFDVGTDTYDTRSVKSSTSVKWHIAEPSLGNSAPLLEGFTSERRSTKEPFVFYLVSLFSLSHPVGKSVNQLGPIGSCGAWGLLHLLTQLWTQGSVAPFQGWPAGPKWRSITTGVTWSTQSVTTNLCPPSSPCRWDTPGRCLLFTVWFCKWFLKLGGCKWFKQSCQSCSFGWFY